MVNVADSEEQPLQGGRTQPCRLCKAEGQLGCEGIAALFCCAGAGSGCQGCQGQVQGPGPLRCVCPR